MKRNKTKKRQIFSVIIYSFQLKKQSTNHQLKYEKENLHVPTPRELDLLMASQASQLVHFDCSYSVGASYPGGQEK
jgi:hypothetical protein